ncbi:MAG: glycosyltransferase [Planctomycetota bacterium]
MNPKHRILFATDVPFWQASTGAEQRILAMYRHLHETGCECGAFYLGQLDANEQAIARKFELNIFENSSDQPPEKLVNRIRWYADATINQAKDWLSQSKSELPKMSLNGPPSLDLADFRWPWAITRFTERIESFQPDMVIFEYIKMAYLMEGMSFEQRERTRCLLDTHDVLHRRAEQFFAHGFPHWIKIDRASETKVLEKFDAVIAIQDQEANTFREMTDSQVEVITVGHAVDRDEPDEALAATTKADRIKVGYIGSKNFSNWQAISEFLCCAWPFVVEKNSDTCELVVAGEICDWLDLEKIAERKRSDDQPDDLSSDNPLIPKPRIENVKMLGRVENIEDFYDQIDVVINPVEFGTGLKIKNAESLRFGKLLITTTNGFDGMPEATRLACKVVENVNEMGLAINSICNDIDSLRPMQSLALQLSQTEFSVSQAYSELERYLQINLPS